MIYCPNLIDSLCNESARSLAQILMLSDQNPTVQIDLTPSDGNPAVGTKADALGYSPNLHA